MTEVAAASEPVAPFGRETRRRFVRAIGRLLTSEVGGKAWAFFAALFVLLIAVSGLNVVNSYVGRDFMTAVELKDRAGFLRQAFRYVAVFGASTVVAVIYRFTEERLGLLWRELLTRRLVGIYLDRRNFYRLELEGRLGNPDQRIAEDARTFVAMTLSLLLLFLNGTITVVAFSGVLWSISRTLFVVGVVYAAAGSGLTVLFGRPLVRLNYEQSDREANFRSELVHVRHNADAIAILGREPQLETRLLDRLAALVANSRRIIAVNRNLGFFVNGYNYMIQIIPALIVAPMFIGGRVEFGVIAQAGIAFTHLLGAFSLIVTQFQSISSYAAVLSRLSGLSDALEHTAAADDRPGIVAEHEGDGLVYEHLTLQSPRDQETLVRDLTLTVPRGTRVLVRGGASYARAALFRATAGLWYAGTGRVVLPEAGTVEFLPENPYVVPGTLRNTLGDGHGGSDERIMAALRALGMEAVVARTGGLDVECDWQATLSLAEQQLVSVARLLVVGVRLAILDRIGTALDWPQVAMVLKALAEHGVAYVVWSDAEEPLEPYDAILGLGDGGAWTWTVLRPERGADSKGG